MAESLLFQTKADQVEMPAVLVETGFIDNPQDARLLTEHGEEFAAAIARGVTDWGLDI